MNPLRSVIIVILIVGSMMVLQACGDSQVDKLRMEADQRGKQVADLQAQLAQTREALARQQDEKSQLGDQLSSLQLKIRELEAQAQKKVEAARTEAKEAPDAGKIGLLGAKAVAEFRAQQLSKRLDKLSADLDKKEQELVKINQISKQKDLELTKLKERIEKLQAADQNRVGELQAKLENISKELEQRSSVATQSQQELKEKSDLLVTLKNAVTDATKLKAASEAEAERLRTELGQITKQLETTKARAAADSQDLQDCAAWAEKAAKELKNQQAAMQQYKGETERLQKEGEQLKSALAELNNKIRAAEAAQEQGSPIDRILESPKAGASAGSPSSNLY
jgi:chromosome segregation ATPase